MESKEYYHIISWSKYGTKVEIKSIPELTSIVLLKFFKYTNMSNFIRQLNLYSFKKVVSANSKVLSYYNQFFHKNSSLECLTHLIRNKLTKKSTTILRQKYVNLASLEEKIKETELSLKEMIIDKERLTELKKTGMEEAKNLFSYIKDLESLIYNALNLTKRKFIIIIIISTAFLFYFSNLVD